MVSSNERQLHDPEQRIRVFQKLSLDILTRRAVFRKFEDGMKGTKLTEYNDVMALVWYGYVISQLSDCRKFFDRDSNSHSFKFIVDHIKEESLKEKHSQLLGLWKNEQLETVLNKYMLHADARFSEVSTVVSVKSLDIFIDQLDIFLKDIVTYLTKNYSDIGSMDYSHYLPDREREVDIFFEEVRKII